MKLKKIWRGPTMHQPIDTPRYSEQCQITAIIDEITRLRRLTNDLINRLDKLENGYDRKKIP